MKINKLHHYNLMGEDVVEVEIEGYPYAQPVFPDSLTEEELIIKIKEWTDKEDIMGHRASVPSPKSEKIEKFKNLEGEEI